MSKKEKISSDEANHSRSVTEFSDKIAGAPARLHVVLETHNVSLPLAQRINGRWFPGWKKFSKFLDMFFKLSNKWPQKILQLGTGR